MIQSTNKLISSNRPKGFEKVTDDFESRFKKQKILNKHDSKLSGLNADHIKRVNRFKRMLHFLNPRPSRVVILSKSGFPHKKTASLIKQEKICLNVNSLGRSEWRSPLFGMREKIIVSAAPSSPESNIVIVPTPNLFSADPVIGDIQNINIAFKQFKLRMTEIGNQYTGEKQKYFFKQLNQCDIDRFKALSTEKQLTISISNVREAETIL